MHFQKLGAAATAAWRRCDAIAMDDRVFGGLPAHSIIHTLLSVRRRRHLLNATLSDQIMKWNEWNGAKRNGTERRVNGFDDVDGELVDCG